jgi:hypothetical protein
VYTRFWGWVAYPVFREEKETRVYLFIFFSKDRPQSRSTIPQTLPSLAGQYQPSMGVVYSPQQPETLPLMTGFDRSSMGVNTPINDRSKPVIDGGHTPIKDRSKPVLDGSQHPHQWLVLTGHWWRTHSHQGPVKNGPWWESTLPLMTGGVDSHQGPVKTGPCWECFWLSMGVHNFYRRPMMGEPTPIVDRLCGWSLSMQEKINPGFLAENRVCHPPPKPGVHAENPGTFINALILFRGLINVPPFSAIHTWFSASTPGFSQPL